MTGAARTLFVKNPKAQGFDVIIRTEPGGINWPAWFDIHAFNPYVAHGLYWVAMSCRKWHLVWIVNFALHVELAKLWRHTDLIHARRLTMTLVSTTSHCSKRDYYYYFYYYVACAWFSQGPLLLTWFNFNPSMDN